MATVAVANTSANISGDTLLTAENSTTVTGALNFDRDPNPPFTVTSGSAVVTNLDADLLDGQHGSYYQSSTNQNAGALPVARLSNGVTTQVVLTTTGTVNNWAPGLSGDTFIRCNNATPLTITGIAGGVAGQNVYIQSIGAGRVTLATQSGSSSAGNKLANYVASGSTVLAPTNSGQAGGVAHYNYDTQIGCWRLVSHRQGPWITETYAAGSFTGSGSMTWTVEAADVTTLAWHLEDSRITVSFYLVNTAIGGTLSTALNILKAAYGGYTATKVMTGYARMEDNSVASVGKVRVPTSFDMLVIEHIDSAVWVATPNVYGQITFEVD